MKGCGDTRISLRRWDQNNDTKHCWKKDCMVNSKLDPNAMVWVEIVEGWWWVIQVHGCILYSFFSFFVQSVEERKYVPNEQHFLKEIGDMSIVRKYKATRLFTNFTKGVGAINSYPHVCLM